MTRTLPIALTALAVTGLALWLWTDRQSGTPTDASNMPNSGGRPDASPTHAAAQRDNGTAPQPVAARDPASTRSNAPPHRAGELLPAERGFLSGGQAQIAVVQSVLTGADFAKRFDLLQAQMAQDSDAMGLAASYQAAIADQLERTGVSGDGMRLACGTGICLGAMRSHGDEAWFDRWQQEFFASPSTPHGVGIDYTADLGGGLREHRIFFTTDPAIRSASVPPARR